MAQGKKISELTEVSSVTDNDEFLFVDKEGSGADSGVGGKTAKIKFSNLKASFGNLGEQGEKGEKGDAGPRGLDGEGTQYWTQSPTDGDAIYYPTAKIAVGTDDFSPLGTNGMYIKGTVHAVLQIDGPTGNSMIGLGTPGDSTGSIAFKHIRDGNVLRISSPNAMSQGGGLTLRGNDLEVAGSISSSKSNDNDTLGESGIIVKSANPAITLLDTGASTGVLLTAKSGGGFDIAHATEAEGKTSRFVISETGNVELNPMGGQVRVGGRFSAFTSDEDPRFNGMPENAKTTVADFARVDMPVENIPFSEVLNNGHTYTIASLDDGNGGEPTDFTLYGAPDNNIGTEFICANGPGYNDDSSFVGTGRVSFKDSSSMQIYAYGRNDSRSSMNNSLMLYTGAGRMGQDKFIISMPKHSVAATGPHDGIVLRTGGNWSSDQSNALVAHPSADVSIPNGTLTVGVTYSKYGPQDGVAIRNSNAVGSSARLTFLGDGMGHLGSIRGEVGENYTFTRESGGPTSGYAVRGDLVFHVNRKATSEIDPNDQLSFVPSEIEAMRITSEGNTSVISQTGHSLVLKKANLAPSLLFSMNGDKFKGTDPDQLGFSISTNNNLESPALYIAKSESNGTTDSAIKVDHNKRTTFYKPTIVKTITGSTPTFSKGETYTYSPGVTMGCYVITPRNSSYTEANAMFHYRSDTQHGPTFNVDIKLGNKFVWCRDQNGDIATPTADNTPSNMLGLGFNEDNHLAIYNNWSTVSLSVTHIGS